MKPEHIDLTGHCEHSRAREVRLQLSAVWRAVVTGQLRYAWTIVSRLVADLRERPAWLVEYDGMSCIYMTKGDALDECAGAHAETCTTHEGEYGYPNPDCGGSIPQQQALGNPCGMYDLKPILVRGIDVSRMREFEGW